MPPQGTGCDTPPNYMRRARSVLEPCFATVRSSACGHFLKDWVRALDPSHPQSKAYLGDILVHRREYPEALELLNQGLEARSDLRIAHYNRGIIFQERSQTACALDEYQQAIRLDPTLADARYRLAKLWRVLGRTDEADREFVLVKELHQKFTDELLQKVSPSSNAGPR